MNTELLRDDERGYEQDLEIVVLLRKRLIEEREESAVLSLRLSTETLLVQSERVERAKLEAELAEALDLVSDAVNHWTGEVWQSDAMDLLGRHNK